MSKMPVLKDIAYVGIQLSLFVLYIIPFHLFSINLYSLAKLAGLLIGLSGLLLVLVAILQLNKSLSPFPTPKEGGTLIQTGLYKYIRHPIYSGIILTTIGFGIFDESIWKMGIGFLLWILFYFKSKYEEQLLLARFTGYKMYAENSYRFFPFM